MEKQQRTAFNTSDNIYNNNNNSNSDFGESDSVTTTKRLHNLCVEAGFNETNFPNFSVLNTNSHLLDQVGGESISSSFDKTKDLEDAVRKLGRANIELTKQLSDQRHEHILLQNKVKVLERFMFSVQCGECHKKNSYSEKNSNISNITNTMLKDRSASQINVEAHVSTTDIVGADARSDSNTYQLSEDSEVEHEAELKTPFDVLVADVAYLKEHFEGCTSQLADVSKIVCESDFENRLNNVVADVDVINKKLEHCNSSLASVSKLVSEPDFENRFNALLADMASTTKKQESCITQLLEVSKIAFHLDAEVERFARRYSLIVENLCPKEDGSAREMLLIFAKSVLNVKLEESDIESLKIIHRSSLDATTNTPEKRLLPRPVLVTFTCYKTQTQFYKSWLSFRCKDTPGSLSKERGQGLSVKEYLTENEKQIYNVAINLKEEHKIIDCWTLKGKTYIKKLDQTVSEFSDSNEIEPRSEARNCAIM